MYSTMEGANHDEKMSSQSEQTAETSVSDGTSDQPPMMSDAEPEEQSTPPDSTLDFFCRLSSRKYIKMENVVAPSSEVDGDNMSESAVEQRAKDNEPKINDQAGTSTQETKGPDEKMSGANEPEEQMEVEEDANGRGLKRKCPFPKPEGEPSSDESVSEERQVMQFEKEWHTIPKDSLVLMSLPSGQHVPLRAVPAVSSNSNYHCGFCLNQPEMENSPFFHDLLDPSNNNWGPVHLESDDDSDDSDE